MLLCGMCWQGWDWVLSRGATRGLPCCDCMVGEVRALSGQVEQCSQTAVWSGLLLALSARSTHLVSVIPVTTLHTSPCAAAQGSHPLSNSCCLPVPSITQQQSCLPHCPNPSLLLCNSVLSLCMAMSLPLVPTSSCTAVPSEQKEVARGFCSSLQCSLTNGSPSRSPLAGAVL